MFDDDLIGWQLDDVLEDGHIRLDDVLSGYDVDFVADGIAIDSAGEPRDPMLNEDVREQIGLTDRVERVRRDLLRRVA